MAASSNQVRLRRSQKSSSQAAESSALPEASFARHETFAPRYGWLKKGFDAVVKDTSIFTHDNAALQLGVGKNMARAIRYWALACGIVEEVPSPVRSGGQLRPSSFGRKLLGARGWDPYLEDLGSLWLLHWQLLRLRGIATAWRHAFFEFGLSEFSVDDLALSLADMVRRRYPHARAASSSLRKDATCIVQMYAGGTLRRVETEESIRSPFTQLELVGKGMSGRQMAFRIGEKPGLSPGLIAALCLDFMNSRGTERSLSFSTILRGEGSPGLALRLSESALYAALEDALHQHRSLRLSDSAGVIQLSVTTAPEQVRDELLDAHYSQSSPRGQRK